MRIYDSPALRRRLPTVKWSRPVLPRPAPPPVAAPTAPVKPPPTPPRGQLFRRLDSEVGRLVRHVRFLREVQALAQEFLPQNLQPWVRLTVSLDDEWCITATHAAAATRLRFSLNSLRSRLSRRLKRPIPVLELRVHPHALPAAAFDDDAAIAHQPTAAPTPPRPRPAATLPQDPRLVSALTRLRRR